jgi:hypothetical protein
MMNGQNEDSLRRENEDSLRRATLRAQALADSLRRATIRAAALAEALAISSDDEPGVGPLIARPQRTAEERAEGLRQFIAGASARRRQRELNRIVRAWEKEHQREHRYRSRFG